MRLFDGASLLELSRRRLAGLFEPHNIWIVTSAAYIDLVAAALPDIPRENLIGEPMGRDTSNAIGLAAHLLAMRDPDATMAVFTADHLISPQDRFAEAIRGGLDAAERFPGSLVTFGITPSGPHTGYGYVHLGRPAGGGARHVLAFKEKPDRRTAEEYLRSGEYLWNSGMFAWRVSAILAELERHLPANSATLGRLARLWQQLTDSDPNGEKASLFGSLQKISIDFGVMEKAASVLCVEMPCQWLDLGSWLAIGATRSPDPAGNSILAERALLRDANNNVVVSENEHLIVALGVSDLVIVHSGDATLVCHREHVEQIRELARLREAQFGDRFE